MSEGDKLFADGDSELSIEGGGSSTSSSTSAIPQIQSQHKTACFFHVLFKGAAILLYLLSVLLFDSFIIGFVACVLLLAFDFWTVKNVTGRLLVGLRWWNEVREDGTNVWIYESKPDNRQVNPNDAFIFWTTLYATPVVWIVFALGALVSLNIQSLLIIAVALTLSGANVVGYWKCQKDAGRRIQSFTSNWLLSRMMSGTTAPAGQQPGQ